MENFNAAKTLLDEPFELTIKGRFFFKERTFKFKVRAIKVYTVIAMSKWTELLEMPEDDQDLMTHIGKNGKNMCKVIACALLNNSNKIKWFSRILSNVLLKSIDGHQLLEIYMQIIPRISINSFFLGMVYMKGQSVMKEMVETSKKMEAELKEGKHSGEQSAES